MAKHTQGLWFNDCGSIVCHDGYTVGHVNSHNTSEGKANANLIAAAPELLAALVNLLDSVQETYDNRHEFRAGLDAVAKATGEQA